MGRKKSTIWGLAAIFLLFSFVQVNACSLQDSVSVNLQAKHITIANVFKTLQQQTGFIVFYNNDILNDQQRVDVNFMHAGVRQVINYIISGQGLTYTIKDRFILLQRKSAETGQLKTDLAAVKVADIPVDTLITGVVKSESGVLLAGVSVGLKGSSLGTITDEDGTYSLRVQDMQGSLMLSYVGYDGKEVSIKGRQRIDVVLKPSVSSLNQLVVVGYGTQKKSDLTGSLSSIDGKALSAFPTTNVARALEGRSAGVYVQQNSGAPGSGIQVRIRGTNSIQGSNEPLWIIDGFPADPNILNPSDIESMEILKDASATAIYGSRGANGVIIVTTKRGKAGKTLFEFNGSYSVQRVRKKLDMMNATQYAGLYNAFWESTHGVDYFSQDQIQSLGKGVDWQDLIFRNAPTQNYSFNVSGGNAKSQFSAGASYFDQQGIVKNSDYRRIGMRISANHDISDKFSVSYNVILARVDNNPTADNLDLLFSALTAPPTVGPYLNDGEYRNLNTVYPFSPDNTINPAAYIKEKSNKQFANNEMANLSLIYTPIEGLSLKVSGNISNTDQRSDSYTSTKYPNSSGSASVSAVNSIHLNSDNIITYTKRINKNDISATAALTYENFTTKALNASGSGFITDVTETDNLGSANTFATPGTSYSNWTLLSYLGRINYAYADKYLVTVSFRADGSSRYSKGNKWGYFPSGALAWKFTKEDFMKGVNWITDGKIRVGYGLTGSTAIDPYYTLNMLQSGKVPFNNDLYTYFAPGTRLPGNLKWESTTQTDIGLDLGFFDNRIRIMADYYIKNTSDLLNPVQLPQSIGYDYTVRNVGKIQNRGFDFELDAKLLDRNLKVDVGANLSLNRNKVLKLYGNQDIQGTVYNLIVINDYANLLQEGKPISAFYGYKFNGLDDQGHYVYKDMNNDGVISEADKTWIGNPNPKFIYGFTADMQWKSFKLNFFIQGTQGNDILCFSLINQNYRYYQGFNTTADVFYDHWSKDNPSAKYPAIDNILSTKMADNFVYNGSYLRLKNVQLAYDLPTAEMGLKWIGACEAYISAQNLLTLTKYPWWDPEVNSKGGDNSINQGIDYYSYPSAKGFTIGIKLSF